VATTVEVVLSGYVNVENSSLLLASDTEELYTYAEMLGYTLEIPEIAK